jgi:hypothetical protein
MFTKGRKVLAGVAALGAVALGASAVAGAATSPSTGTTSTTSQNPSSTHPPPSFNGPAPGTAAHEDAEKPVTGSAAAKAQAAAVKLVGSGTAGAVTTDLSGKGFETTVTKADGTKVEVHLDSSFNAFAGPGGPGRPGRGASGPPGSAGSGSSNGPPPGAPYGG